MTVPADIAIHCGSRIHQFGPFAPAPEAEYWLNWHGCNESLACYGCVTDVTEHAQGKLDRGELLICGHCERIFMTSDEYVKWVRL
ncbi:hypothetical protein ACFYY5_29340 [Nocardia elegans]|uniref:Uncharacterized protein n=1 Tax=Nocardia elegans TaxID=300029 RepID=A0ABW6TMC1_9NOCA